MPPTLEWSDIALRLALTMVAAAAIGFNRGEHDRPAGLRTTLLVCLAASIAMIQVNLLLPITGKANDSYVVLDLMRLPLGILSGVGFIGAGAIIRKDNRTAGVTTAATLWYVTVIGLCFGGEQLGLGLAGTALGIFVLWYLKWVENLFPKERRATLILDFETAEPIDREFRSSVTGEGFAIIGESVAFFDQARFCEARYELRWRAAGHAPPPSFLTPLAQLHGVRSLRWEPIESH